MKPVMCLLSEADLYIPPIMPMATEEKKTFTPSKAAPALKNPLPEICLMWPEAANIAYTGMQNLCFWR